MLDSNLDVNKLTCEIFSILESIFLFGYDDPKLSLYQKHQIPLQEMRSGKHVTGKVRILSIDGGGAIDGVLAAKSLSHLESCPRQKSSNLNARIADYFDVVARSGVGGILAALLFTRGKDGGSPICTAEEALEFVTKNWRRIFRSRADGLFRLMFRHRTFLRRTFHRRPSDFVPPTIDLLLPKDHRRCSTYHRRFTNIGACLRHVLIWETACTKGCFIIGRSLLLIPE